MTIHAVRIVKAKHAANAFSGDGARRFGGRWNLPGMAMVYTAGSASLAILEMLVHFKSDELLKKYVLFDVTFDEALVNRVDPAILPKTWRRSPASSSVQRIGSAWVEGGASSVLRVPSTIVPSEWNYLLNPAHADFPAIKIGLKKSVQFDPRLMKRP